MGWKHIHRVWAPTWRQRIKQAWKMLRTGSYTFEMEYRLTENPPEVYIGDELLLDDWADEQIGGAE